MNDNNINQEKVLEDITRKRVGRALDALDLANSPNLLKTAIKKQFWEMKNEIERKVLQGEDYDDVFGKENGK